MRTLAFCLRMWPLLLIAGLSCIVVLLYVGAEDQIYYWDFGGYYKRFVSLGDTIATGQFSLREFVWSVRHEDYNLAPVLPLMPAYLVAGDSREVYVSVLMVLYWMPVCLLAATISDFSRTSVLRAPHKVPVWIIAAAALYWPFLATVMRGFPDIAGLIPFGLACLLIVNPKFWSTKPILRGVALAILVWSVFALRRWYAYSCASLLLVAGLVALWSVYRSDDRIDAFRKVALEYGVCGVTLLSLLALQWPLVSRIISTSYADAYADYQRPFPQHLIILYDQIGPLLTIGIVAGVIRAVREQNRTILLLSSVALVSFVFFCLTQAPGMQHALPWLFLLFPAFIAGLSWPFRARVSQMRKWGALAVMAISTAVVFWPAAANTFSFGQIVLPNFKYPPMKVQNVENYRTLAADLSAILEPEDKVVVYAWTREVSSAMLEAIDPGLMPHMFHASLLDRRDGFRTEALDAKYAVVMEEPSSQTQHVTKIPTQATVIPTTLIREGRGFGSAYRVVGGPYQLSSCVFTTVELRCTPDESQPLAFIYERNRSITTEERRDLRDRFLAIYPNWQDRPGGYGPP